MSRICTLRRKSSCKHQIAPCALEEELKNRFVCLGAWGSWGGGGAEPQSHRATSGMTKPYRAETKPRHGSTIASHQTTYLYSVHEYDIGIVKTKIGDSLLTVGATSFPRKIPYSYHIPK